MTEGIAFDFPDKRHIDICHSHDFPKLNTENPPLNEMTCHAEKRSREITFSSRKRPLEDGMLPYPHHVSGTRPLSTTHDCAICPASSLSHTSSLCSKRCGCEQSRCALRPQRIVYKEDCMVPSRQLKPFISYHGLRSLPDSLKNEPHFKFASCASSSG